MAPEFVQGQAQAHGLDSCSVEGVFSCVHSCYDCWGQPFDKNTLSLEQQPKASSSLWVPISGATCFWKHIKYCPSLLLSIIFFFLFSSLAILVSSSFNQDKMFRVFLEILLRK
jgi:hypothetical protein